MKTNQSSPLLKQTSLNPSSLNSSSLSQTINDINWSGVVKTIENQSYMANPSQITNHIQKSLLLNTCPQYNQVHKICVNQNCKINYSLLCSDSSCKCTSDHKSCTKGYISSIIELINQKTKRTDQIKKYIQTFFDQKFDQLLELRQYFINQMEKLKLIQLTDKQLKFIDFISIKNKQIQKNNLMSKKQLSSLWKMNINYAKIRQQNIFNKTKQEFDKFNFSFINNIDSLKVDFNIMIQSFSYNKNYQGLSLFQYENKPKLINQPNLYKPINKPKLPIKQNGINRLQNFMNPIKTPPRQNVFSRNYNSKQRKSISRNKTQQNSIVSTPRSTSKTKRTDSSDKKPKWVP